MDDAVTVTCPYCGEDLEIYVEPDVYVEDHQPDPRPEPPAVAGH